MSVERRRQMIEPEHPSLSVVRQCELVSISRSPFYCPPMGETAEKLALMRLIGAQFLETPWHGLRQMARHLRRDGRGVGRKRVRRLMAKMGLAPIYQRPRTTVPKPEHRLWPYLLRDMAVDRAHQAWCADLTCIPMRRGFLRLVAVMDWATGKVLPWRVSNTMDAEFCVDAWQEALARFGRPEMFNSDPAKPRGGLRGAANYLVGVHRRAAAGGRAHLHGRPGRWMGNVLVERLRRSLRYGCICLHAFETGSELRAGLLRWISCYNARRPHSTLAGRTPDEAYEAGPTETLAA